MQYMLNWNGSYIPLDSLVLPISFSDHSQITQLTETIRVFNAKALFIEKHYFHLMASMRILRMDIPMDYTPTFFEETIQQYIQKLNVTHATLSFSVGLINNKVNYWITAESKEATIFEKLEKPLEIYRESHVSNNFFSQLFVPDPFRFTYDVYCKENGFDDVFLLNENKRLARTVKGSIFLLEGNKIETPKKEEGSKNGVFREQLIEILKKVPEIDQVEETELFPFALQKADEVFILQEGFGIKAIAKFRKKQYSTQTTESVIVNRLKEQFN